jgi:hypothetical protein
MKSVGTRVHVSWFTTDGRVTNGTKGGAEIGVVHVLGRIERKKEKSKKNLRF